MDAFHNQNIALFKLHGFAAVITLAFHKIVRRNAYFLAVEQVLQIAVKLLDVEGFERFVIVLAVFVPRGQFAPHIVRIQFDDLRLVAEHLQLHRELF